jgi:hypothetical protein
MSAEEARKCFGLLILLASDESQTGDATAAAAAKIVRLCFHLAAQ